MEYSRAEAILASPQKIEVLHQTIPVWILSVDPEQKTALVNTEAGTGVMEVPVGELEEINN